MKEKEKRERGTTTNKVETWTACTGRHRVATVLVSTLIKMKFKNAAASTKEWCDLYKITGWGGGGGRGRARGG